MYNYFLSLEDHIDGVQFEALCPFHQETEPSFVIDPREDTWFCFGCGEGGGPVTFLQRYLGVTKSTAQYIYEFYKSYQRLPLPTQQQVDNYHKQLLGEDELIAYFSKLGVGIDLLKEFKIGWDMQNARIVFPIPSRRNGENYINLRKYKPEGSNERKSKLISLKNLGDTIFYPYKAFDEERIFIVEGEKDMIAGRGKGLNTITSTGGANVPKLDHNLFKNKKVYIMVDNDRPGDKLAAKYLEALRPHAAEIYRVKLPEKDISDAVVTNPEIDVFDYVEEFNLPEEETTEINNIQELFKPENQGAKSKVENIRVVGENMSVFQVPYEVTLNNGTIKQVQIRDILTFLSSTDEQVKQFILRGEEDDVVIDSRKDVSAQTVYFKTDINMYQDNMAEDTQNSMQGIFISRDGETIKTNRVYDMTLVRTTHPKTQEQIFIILEAEEKIMETNIDVEDLEYFRDEETPISELLDKYYDIWGPHLEVNGRKDVFTVMLLTYLSVLEFNWRNSKIKGRLDSIIIGDTRTGKTKMVKQFMNVLRMGEYVSGENAKATGIIGGINQIGNSWSLNWGKIPINDKRLVVIDEASGLSIDDITDLSQMRSEGILSITKIKQETTYARTRLLWITNPRSGNKIENHYWNGYQALTEFLPIQEDLARFDLACSAAIGDVDNIFEYSDKELMTEAEIDRWRKLVLYAWHVPSEQIEISPEATQDLMDKSIKLGEKLNNNALFMAVNGYEKLARIAIALAVLTFNVKDDILTVERRHVIYAVDLILELYSKDTFSLAAKADAEKVTQQMDKEVVDKLDKLSIIYDNLDILFRDGEVSQSMVSTILGIDNDGANKVISELYSMGLVELGRNSRTIKPTPNYLNYLRREK